MISISLSEGYKYAESDIHIVPVVLNQGVDRIDDAEVSAYFIPTIQQTSDGQYKSLFQGHMLVGTSMSTPNLCLIYAKRSHQNPSSCNLSVLEKVNCLKQWRRERPWKQNQGNIPTMQKYINLQKVLHQTQ